MHGAPTPSFHLEALLAIVVIPGPSKRTFNYDQVQWPAMENRLRGETFDVGDRVRIDIPDETHPEFRHHGQNGEVIAVLSHGERRSIPTGPTGREVRVDLDEGGVVDVAAEYVRPPI